jgi:hypothetical protein
MADDTEHPSPSHRSDSSSKHQDARGRRRRQADEPFEVHIEFVMLDGEAGKKLARRQAAIMRRVLKWLHDHPADGGSDNRATG